MPLDLSRVALNPKFYQQIVRIRRPYTLVMGQPLVTPIQQIILATITIADPNDLSRLVSGDVTTYIKSINIITTTSLNAATDSAYADIILFKNEAFEIQGTYPYEANGFCRAIATLSNYVASIGG